MNERTNSRNYDLACYYYSKKTPVHITLLGGKWYNGIILNVNQDFKDRLVLLDEKFGEMLIYFDRIIEDGIEPKKEEGR
jgi:hypothetical protein